MPDENDAERELRVGEYHRYRREVVGRDGEGNPIFGPKEPIDGDGPDDDQSVQDVIDSMEELTDEEVQKVMNAAFRRVYGLTFESNRLDKWSGDTDAFTTTRRSNATIYDPSKDDEEVEIPNPLDPSEYELDDDRAGFQGTISNGTHSDTFRITD